MHLIMDVISTGFRGPAPIRTTQNPFSIKIALKMDTTEIIFATDDRHNAISITNDGELRLIYIILMSNFDR